MRVKNTQWYDLDMQPVAADSGRAVYCVLEGTELPDELAKKLHLLSEAHHERKRLAKPPEDKAAIDDDKC